MVLSGALRTIQSLGLRQDHGTLTRASIVHNPGSQPCYNSQWGRPLPLFPQHNHPELEGISQVVQANPVYFLWKKLGSGEK